MTPIWSVLFCGAGYKKAVIVCKWVRKIYLSLKDFFLITLEHINTSDFIDWNESLISFNDVLFILGFKTELNRSKECLIKFYLVIPSYILKKPSKFSDPPGPKRDLFLERTYEWTDSMCGANDHSSGWNLVGHIPCPTFGHMSGKCWHNGYHP